MNQEAVNTNLSNLITYWNKDICDALIKKKLSIEELIILYSIYHDNSSMDNYFAIETDINKYLYYQQLEVEGYIIIENKTLTQKGEETVEEFMNLWGVNEFLTEKENISDDEFMNNCIKYVQLFNRKYIGYSDKSCNPKEVLLKFKKFFKENPQYTWNDVLEATKYRIEEMRQTNRLKFIQKANYFIYKRTELTKDSEVSALLNAIVEWKENSEEQNDSLLNDRTI